MIDLLANIFLNVTLTYITIIS